MSYGDPQQWVHIANWYVEYYQEPAEVAEERIRQIVREELANAPFKVDVPEVLPED